MGPLPFVGEGSRSSPQGVTLSTEAPDVSPKPLFALSHPKKNKNLEASSLSLRASFPYASHRSQDSDAFKP